VAFEQIKDMAQHRFVDKSFSSSWPANRSGVTGAFATAA